MKKSKKICMKRVNRRSECEDQKNRREIKCVRIGKLCCVYSRRWRRPVLYVYVPQFFVSSKYHLAGLQATVSSPGIEASDGRLKGASGVLVKRVCEARCGGGGSRVQWRRDDALTPGKERRRRWVRNWNRLHVLVGP